MLAGAATSFGNLFTRLSQDTRLPTVIHCVGGKDRTCLAVALLLTAPGVDRELVLDDYQLTDQYREHCSCRTSSACSWQPGWARRPPKQSSAHRGGPWPQPSTNWTRRTAKAKTTWPAPQT
jgi:hypothetical protein